MAALKALLLALTVSSALVVSAPAHASGSGAFKPRKEQNAKVMRAYRAEILRLVNRERTSRGLRALRPLKCANRFAAELANQMDRENSFHHSNLASLLPRCGLQEAGENIEIGARSAKATVRAWMHSPGHRANILTASYRLSGIGLVYDNSRRRWIAVQDFGAR
ncbi:CAP domain-containing protein [Nocardioides sp. Kera G14]|uniref:CAP domain-containing protein n=1 Tax=Nocardioides sp. Kera G14 TaxID=2884264 RepID=UPI001D109850|nr:CAP domain-containing protein [Nocardioides sp. Kera G14]UDY23244.1 CAP domain-containing protein [Nocardioides sp. Kera G14]